MFKKRLETLIEKINTTDDAIKYLIDQNTKILEEQKELQMLIKNSTLPKPIDMTKNKKYSSYEKGAFNTPKVNFFDSPAEKQLEKYLDHICKKYDLGANWGIRVLSHQPLINYVESTTIKAVNSRNALMHFDFLFEERKLKDNDIANDKAGHIPLLAIELDGKTHDTYEQIERDDYKKGACDKLNLHLIRIKYNEDCFTFDQIETHYLCEIMTYLFVSMFNLTAKYKTTNSNTITELLKVKCDEILSKYPNNQFPEVQQFVKNAYNIFLNQNP